MTLNAKIDEDAPRSEQRMRHARNNHRRHRDFCSTWAKTPLGLIAKAMGKRVNNLDSTDVVEAFDMSLE